MERVVSRDGQIALTKSCRDVVAVMEQDDVDPRITERITYLDGLADDEPTVSPESLQKFAVFVVTRRHLPYQLIGLAPDGFIEAVWDTSDGDMLTVDFPPVGDVRFVVLLATSESEPRQRSLGGLLPPDDMMGAIRPFVDKLIRA